MTQPASVGTLSQCAIGAGTPTVAFEYKSFGLKLHQEIISTDGIRGTHNHPSERTRLGKSVCSGPIVLQPGPADLDVLLPFITGSVKTVNTFGLGETLTAFSVVVDRVSKVYSYANCYIDKATFKAGQGEPLELTLQIEALTEAIANAGTFAGAFNLAAPYVMMDAVLTIGGTAYQFKEFSLTVDNHLKKDRFMNSVTRTDLPFLDRVVECDLHLPSTSDQATLLAYTGVTAESFNITFTNGANSFTITSSAFQIEPQSPDTPGRDEILLPVHGAFRGLGATIPITFTNVG